MQRSSFWRLVRASTAGVASAVALGSFVDAVAVDSTASQATMPGVARRLTISQYTAIVRDTFGPTIKLGGRFEPDTRKDGLIEVGSSQVSVSSTGLDQYDTMARSIAEQVLNKENRAEMLPCKPASATAPDDVCAKKFLGKVGASLFRRPLTDEELTGQVAAAARAANTLHDFYTGLSLTLASMLEAPEFLFRIEDVESDPEVKGGFRLNSIGRAERLSFFLWNAPPDRELTMAAERGELTSKRGLEKQVSRMLTSARVKDGVRAFFDDMLQLQGMEDVQKDSALFPKFSSQVSADAREQTLRTITNVVLAPQGDYRDIFTTNHTFMTPTLAAIYKVPMVQDAPIGAPDYWQAFDFEKDDPRAGILMQTSFVTMNSHPGRSSPTLRGKALREVIMCQRVPPPPGDVKFDIVQDTSNPVYRTARARLEAHRSNPVCAGCHKLIDPMGLALENFDGGGAYRTAENGVKIDTSGEMDGKKFTDAKGLGQVIRDSPATSSCLVRRMTAYGLGRTPSKSEEEWLGALNTEFAKAGYNIPALMRRLVTDPAFYRIPSPETKSASLN